MALQKETAGVLFIGRPVCKTHMNIRPVAVVNDWKITADGEPLISAMAYTSIINVLMAADFKSLKHYELFFVLFYLML